MAKNKQNKQNKVVRNPVVIRFATRLVAEAVNELSVLRFMQKTPEKT